MARRISKVLRRKRRAEEDGQEFSVWLDRDSIQRLERLRSKFKRFDDGQLIAFALRSLERQMIRIVKRQVLKKIRALENRGLSSQQIADHFNIQGVPVPGQAGKWNDGTIARLSGEDGE